MNRRILNLAIPNIISNLSVPLLGAVDTALVGHLDEVYYLGALAVGGMIFNFLFWGFGFLRMGTTGLTAQAYGKRDRTELIMILMRVQAVAFCLGVAILLLQQPVAALSFWVVESSTEVEHYTLEYFYIRIYTAPAVLALYGINGWFLGMQNAKYPMVITILLNLLNIGLNVFFIYGLDMHVDGVAWGTVLATYVALLLAVFLFFRKYKTYVFHYVKSEFLNLVELGRFFTVNRDIFIRTLCLIFAFSFFTAKSAAQGDLILAANSILLQLWMIASYGIDGFAYSAESLVGRFKGSGETRQLRRAVGYTMIWGITLGLTGSMVYGIFDSTILSIFTDKQDVIELARSVMIWTIMAPAIASICYIWDGIFIGATATVPMRNTMLVATLLFYLPIYYVGTYFFDVHGLWIAMILFMLIRGVSLTFYAPRYIFETEGKSTERR